MIDAIISLTHKLKLRLVAEGVETVEQLRLLQAMGCNHGTRLLLRQTPGPPPPPKRSSAPERACPDSPTPARPPRDDDGSPGSSTSVMSLRRGDGARRNAAFPSNSHFVKSSLDFCPLSSHNVKT